jgi:DNA-binding Lrp family transcriptional regulator
MVDQTDRMLLALLKEDTKRKYSELGEIVHLSAPAVHERVKKLERAGVIHKYTIEVDPEVLGLALLGKCLLGRRPLRILPRRAPREVSLWVEKFFAEEP